VNNPPSSSVWGALFRRRDPWALTVATLWSETPLFEGIPKAKIISLARNLHPRQYQAGEYIFHVGDHGAGVALMLSGAVAIKSGNITLATMKRGDFFGEISLVMDERRTADAVCLESCELVFFLRPDLDEWTARAPHHGARLTTNLAHVLARRLLHANHMLAQQKAD